MCTCISGKTVCKTSWRLYTHCIYMYGRCTVSPLSIINGVLVYRSWGIIFLSMQIPFSELELGDTIIMPRGFNVNYCSGTCTFPQISSPKYNTTKHSHIQSIAAHYNPEYVPTPCCIPHEYLDVEVLYEELPGVFSLHNFTSAAVKSCGCK